MYQPDMYSRGTIIETIRESEPQEDGTITQFVTVRNTNGEIITAEHTIDPLETRGRVFPRDSVVIVSVPNGNDGGPVHYVSDNYRLPQLGAFVVFFLLIVIALGRKRGVTSLIGLASSVAVLFGYILPLIVAGYNPILITLTGSIGIIGASMYFAHGFKKSTTLAIVSTTITLGIATALAYLGVHLAHLTGTGTEEAMFVQLSPDLSLDLQGILLAGIIIGALGVLDDITTAQTAAVHELHDAKPDISRAELFMRVMRIGREHIASLVNTLVLAYVGASFPLFLLLYTNSVQPLWTIINSQQISEEIVRTLVGSIALVLAVPISSAIASYYYTKKRS